MAEDDVEVVEEKLGGVDEIVGVKNSIKKSAALRSIWS
jgi:hypothetical protein